MVNKVTNWHHIGKTKNKAATICHNNGHWQMYHYNGWSYICIYHLERFQYIDCCIHLLVICQAESAAYHWPYSWGPIAVLIYVFVRYIKFNANDIGWGFQLDGREPFFVQFLSNFVSSCTNGPYLDQTNILLG